jgi:RNA polymerase sigma-70 factor (ECF subfamily)
VVREFLRTTHTGDVPALLTVLAPDVVQIADGGGTVAVARRPVHGRDRVARLLTGVTGTRVAPVTVERTQHNGLPSVLLRSETGELEYLLVLDVGADALVHGVYVVADPSKLASAADVRPLTRKDSPW